MEFRNLIMYYRPPPTDPTIVNPVDVERNWDLKMLYKAAVDGDWKAARGIFVRDPEAKTAPLNQAGATPLHVAARCGQSEFVENLVSLLSAQELQIRDSIGTTALHQVALAANVKAAKAMVNKNPLLPQIVDNGVLTPFFHAARWRHPSRNKDMLEYLYSVTDKQLLCTSPSAPDLFIALTSSDCFDIALRLLDFKPALALAPSPEGWSILHFLAAKPSAFVSGSKLLLWERLMYPRTKQRHSDSLKLVHFICNELEKRGDSAVHEYFWPPNHLRPILHLAIQYGVLELVQVCLQHFPDLMWQESREGKHLLHVAVEYRQVRIFDHIIRLVGGSSRAYVEIEFEGKNNILHLAARLAPWRELHSVPGPAFQIQRELQWFKAVDALVSDEQRFSWNSDRKTPQELFFVEHKDLLNSAKEWMNKTSNSCMVVATLVATVAFAAMITVPGGNDSNTGMPNLSKKKIVCGIFHIECSVYDIFCHFSSYVSICSNVEIHGSRFFGITS